MLPRLAPIARAERRQCHGSISEAPPCTTIRFLSPLAPPLRDSTCPVLTWPSSLPKFPRKYGSVSPPKQVPEASSDEVMVTNVTGMLDKHRWWCNQNTVVFFSPAIFCHLFSRDKSASAQDEISSKHTTILLTPR